MYNKKTYNIVSLRKDQSDIASKMDPKLENLDVSADESENISIESISGLTPEKQATTKLLKVPSHGGRKGFIYLTEHVGLP